jgi:tetratricopeptide (TPR) repeat protein
MLLLLPLLLAFENPAGRGVDLALKGNCADAMPLLDQSMRDPEASRDTKRTVATVGVRCSMLLNRQNDPMSFIGWLKDAYPGDPEILALSARMFSDLSDRNAQELLDTAPDSPLVVELNAENFEKHGDIGKAIAEYRILLHHVPDKPGVQCRIGGLILDRPAEAKKEFEAELKINPDNAGAEYYLRDIARQDSDVPSSIPHFKRAMEIYPAFGEAWAGLGRALLDSGKAADAAAALETAAKLVPDNPTVHLALAIAYQRTGHKEDAAREFALQKSAAEKLNRTNTTLRKNVAGAQ